jgi:hypothetical protein
MRGQAAQLRTSPTLSQRKNVFSQANPGHPVIKSYNGRSYLHYPDIQDGVKSDNMVQTEGFGQTEESIMRHHHAGGGVN